MTNIKTYNAISSKGLDYLKDHHYDINGNDAPKGILLRSQNLHDEPIDDNVRAIVRAGAGFNNILLRNYQNVVLLFLIRLVGMQMP